MRAMESMVEEILEVEWAVLLVRLVSQYASGSSSYPSKCLIIQGF